MVQAAALAHLGKPTVMAYYGPERQQLFLRANNGFSLLLILVSYRLANR